MKNKTFNQNKNQFLRIKNWVDNHKLDIPREELRAFELLRNDLLNHNYNISTEEFLNYHMEKIRNEWKLYKIYNRELVYNVTRTNLILKKISVLNTKLLVLQNTPLKFRTREIEILIRARKRKLKKQIEERN